MQADWKSLPINPTCVASLRALVDGRFADFTGVAGCTRRDVEEAYGPSEASVGVLGASQRVASAGATHSAIEAVYRDGALWTVLVRPTWPADQLASLGAPDDTIASGYGPLYQQRTWPRHGVIAHVDLAANRPWIVAAFPPAPLDAIQASLLYQLGGSEHVIEPRPPLQVPRK